MYVDEGYVDYYGRQMSMMIADTDEELHTMAKLLGLRRITFAKGLSHYYTVPSDLRDSAIARGALLVERKVILAKI